MYCVGAGIRARLVFGNVRKFGRLAAAANSKWDNSFRYRVWDYLNPVIEYRCFIKDTLLMWKE